MTLRAQIDLAGRAAEVLRGEMGPERVVTSGPAFDAARTIWNGAVAHRPGVVVRCGQPGDAQAAVQVARDLALPLSVRGGGHDWAGRALTEGGLTLEMGGLRQVSIDPVAMIARVGGGATAADVATAAREHGLVAVTGTAGAVGMVGLSLAGGYGPLSGRFGLAVDNVLSVDLVLADGSAVTADPEHEPDLFWALRGGGGNFGVVTAMNIRLHRVPTLLAGMIMYPWVQAPSALAALADVLLDGPDELTVQTGIVTGPGGDPVLFLAPAWSGEADQAERALASLAALGEPVMAQLGPTELAELLASTDGMFPFGRHIEIRPRTLPGLTPSARSALLAGGDALTSPLSAVSLHSLHGAAARIPASATAFGNRTAHLVAETIAVWEPGDEAASRHRGWARGLSAALAPEALPGGYPNLLAADETDQITHAYGPNTTRLLDIKRRYDPDVLFRATPLPAAGTDDARGTDGNDGAADAG
ncbi:FAD-binding oxidoreductase [Parafrankia sp. FMc2]|uniref:FAD-binding oxidoreductase n=1 Tax=Parafrankia sp. FMc2 TaxID=3233196 RepID=UPI0034D60092